MCPVAVGSVSHDIGGREEAGWELRESSRLWSLALESCASPGDDAHIHTPYGEHSTHRVNVWVCCYCVCV